ncbi:MAG: M56 family metallopeptidase [Lachnospiraceae bacterium]|nr:M56 family metallopeptidase [Lachnospiraceae bacterium]
MSIEWIVSSSALILLVLLVRFLFKKKISPCLRYGLWLIIALRLLCPFSISGTRVSILNLLPELTWERAVNESGQIIYEQNGGADGTMAGFGAASNAPEALIIEKDADEQGIETANWDAEDQSIGQGKSIEQSKSMEHQAVNWDTMWESDGEAVELFAEYGKRIFTIVSEKFTNGNEIDISMILRLIWILGAGICGSIFLLVNVDYSRRLKSGRERIETENLPVLSAIPVYKTEMIQTPCLFGVFAPAVYVTEDTLKEEQTFRFVLCHENTHYMQRDHWWAFVRVLCLCVHWFNPLVWLAADLSRQDGEMACDEKALKMLGDKVRLNYGKILLELSAGKSAINGWRISTTMSGNARQMKERLGMIVNTPGRKRGMQILVVVLAALLSVVTFTGKSRAQESENLYAEDGERAAADAETNTDKANADETNADKANADESNTAEKNADEKNAPAGSEGYKDNLTEMENQASRENGGDKAQEVEFYREITPVVIGEKEYELWSEGHTSEYGFYIIDAINLVDPDSPEKYVDSIRTEEISRAHWNTPVEQEAIAVESTRRNGGLLTADLNFDGWNDLCFEGWITNANEPYYCMLWNPDLKQYEFSTVLCNVEVDEEERFIIESTRDGDGQYSTTYYRYDEERRLHMIRYVEENLSPDAVFEQLDLTYVEDEDSIYMLPAIVDEEDIFQYSPYTLLAMAKQALLELYQWTGQKVDTACFEVTNLGDVFFGMTREDVIHSRVFYSRAFGADTAYNLSDYDKMISSMYITTGRSAWYSPVFWNVYPDQMDKMTDEEIIIWYLEQTPLVKDCKVKSIEKRYADMWTVQTETDVWLEVFYNAEIKEIGAVTGPYPDYPEH